MKVFAFELRRVVAAAAALGILPGIGAYAQKTAPLGAGKPGTPYNAMADQRATLKARFGFTDEQVTAFMQKATVIGESYRPRVMALQKKYGPSPTPEQIAKRNAEFFPMIREMGLRTHAAMLQVATPTQRPRIERELAIEAAALRKASRPAAPVKPK